MSKRQAPTINSDTAQPGAFVSDQGVSLPADAVFVMIGTEGDRVTPRSAVLMLRAEQAQVARALSAEEARAVAQMLVDVAEQIEAVAAKAAADALAKMVGGSA